MEEGEQRRGEEMGLTVRQRQAVMEELRKQYHHASKKEKSRILDGFVGLTHLNRSYARSTLRAKGAQGRGPVHVLTLVEPVWFFWRSLLAGASLVEHAVFHFQEHLPNFVKRLCYAEVELVPLGFVCHPVDQGETREAQRPHMLAPLCRPVIIRESADLLDFQLDGLCSFCLLDLVLRNRCWFDVPSQEMSFLLCIGRNASHRRIASCCPFASMLAYA